MAKYANPAFLDGGFTAFKANVNQMVLLKAYTAGDSYATTTANLLASVAMATGDFTLTGADAAARVMTSAVKTGVTASASSGASPALHVVFRDTVNSIVYWATEATNQVVTSGNTVNFPAVTYTSGQPT